MKAVARILLMLALATAVHAQNSVSSTSTNAVQTVPLVVFSDVPITVAIENLARESGVNYLIEPEVEQAWKDSEEPIINCKIQNVGAKEVLLRLLDLRHLALVEDPVSSIAFIIRANQITNALFASLPTTATNTAYFHTNGIIPLIQFADVPITTAIENLLRQESVLYMIDPKLTELGYSSRSYADYVPEPLLNIRLENVTAWNTINRILNIRNLVLLDNPITHIARLTRSGTPLPVVDASLVEMDTNNLARPTNSPPVVIQFSDTPLDVILENLIHQSSLHIKLNSRIKEPIDPRKGWFKQMPILSMRLEDVSPKQVILALCQNYGLVITKDFKTGVIQIIPK